jgi:hypothetical protein|tara:strand:+ start:1517 stop:2386 length:870 start_codon:yes stop_codon:yes gene_type:complete
MASEEEKFKGFRPYFKTSDAEDVRLKEISLMPSTIETIDRALYNWLDEELNVFCTTNEGWQKVPLIWSMAERAHQIKSSKDLRNKEGIFTLPVMVLERKNLVKDPAMKGVAWAHVPPYNDPRGGAIEVARRIQQDKTGNFANADSQRRFKQQNYRFKNTKVVYETISMPTPTYVVATYTLVIRSEYQQQMNEIFTPFIVTTGQISNFFINDDGHKFEGFLEGDFTLTNNVANLAEEERKFETTINLKILGYLLGAGKNEKRPKVAIRENAVEVRIPRERVIFGDMKDWK